MPLWNKRGYLMSEEAVFYLIVFYLIGRIFAEQAAEWAKSDLLAPALVSS